MKKILSTLIVFCIIFSSVGTNAVDRDALYDEYDLQVSFLNELGIIDSTVFPTGGRTFTRGEFAVFAARLLGEQATSNNKSMFMDVTSDSMFSSSISVLAEAGYISGNLDGSFRPGEYIAPAEAVKILVEILGYGAYARVAGGYPHGYYKIADKIGLTWGSYPRDATTIKSVVKLLYNALHVPMLDVTSVTKDGDIHYESLGESATTGKTLLSTYFDIYYTEGLFETTPTSSLSCYNTFIEETVSIGGSYYKSDSRFDRYLGYHVHLWYKDNDAGKSVAFIYPTRKNSEITVTSDEDMSLNAGEIVYYSDGKKSQKKLSSDVCITYNGSALDFLKDYNSELLSFEDGYIKLIDNDNDNMVDVVKITSYQHIIFDSIDSNDEGIKIYGAFNNKPLEFDFKDASYSICDILGRSLNFDDLKQGDILSVAMSKDKKNLEILVSYNCIEGMVEQVETDDRCKYITVNGNAYTMLNSAVT